MEITVIALAPSGISFGVQTFAVDDDAESRVTYGGSRVNIRPISNDGLFLKKFKGPGEFKPELLLKDGWTLVPEGTYESARQAVSERYAKESGKILARLKAKQERGL